MNRDEDASSAVSKGDRTRERIKRAVVALAAEHGGDFSVQDLCREARITHGGLYFHFSSKEDVLVEVVKDWMARFKTAVLNVAPEADFFTETYNSVLTYVVGYSENVAFTRLVYTVDSRHVEVQRVFGSYQTRWIARLEQRFSAARREAGLSIGMEYMLAVALTGMTEMICRDAYLAQLPGVAEDAANRERFAGRIAVIWHRAVLSRDPPAARMKRFGA